MIWTMPGKEDLAKDATNNVLRLTLPSIGHAKIRHTEFLDVLLEGGALCAGVRLRDKLFRSGEVLTRGSATINVCQSNAVRMQIQG